MAATECNPALMDIRAHQGGVAVITDLFCFSHSITIPYFTAGTLHSSSHN